jgi:hypothetical protein
VTAGYDPRLAEFFAITHPDREDAEFTSAPTRDFDALEAELHQRTGISVPASVKKAILQDYVDFRMGATDIGRRVFHYDSSGTALEAALS